MMRRRRPKWADRRLPMPPLPRTQLREQRQGRRNTRSEASEESSEGERRTTRLAERSVLGRLAHDCDAFQLEHTLRNRRMDMKAARKKGARKKGAARQASQASPPPSLIRIDPSTVRPASATDAPSLTHAELYAVRCARKHEGETLAGQPGRRGRELQVPLRYDGGQIQRVTLHAA